MGLPLGHVLDDIRPVAEVPGVANPYTTILGHPTGRQLLRRPGYEVDVEAVLAACAAHGVAVEINANPYRLELDWRWHEKALALGCLLSINPDAHPPAELDLMKWGVAAARKGGVPKDKVLNAMNLDQVLAHLRKRHQRIGRSHRRGAGILGRPVAVHPTRI